MGKFHFAVLLAFFLAPSGSENSQVFWVCTRIPQSALAIFLCDVHARCSRIWIPPCMHRRSLALVTFPMQLSVAIASLCRPHVGSHLQPSHNPTPEGSCGLPGVQGGHKPVYQGHGGAGPITGTFSIPNTAAFASRLPILATNPATCNTSTALLPDVVCPDPASPLE